MQAVNFSKNEPFLIDSENESEPKGRITRSLSKKTKNSFKNEIQNKSRFIEKIRQSLEKYQKQEEILIKSSSDEEEIPNSFHKQSMENLIDNHKNFQNNDKIDNNIDYSNFQDDLEREILQDINDFKEIENVKETDIFDNKTEIIESEENFTFLDNKTDFTKTKKTNFLKNDENSQKSKKLEIFDFRKKSENKQNNEKTENIDKLNIFKRRFSALSDSVEKWPLYLGSFLIPSQCPFLTTPQYSELISKKHEIEVFSDFIEDSIQKRSNGNYQHKICSDSLRNFLRFNGCIIDKITHFCDQIWSFLINFHLVELKTEIYSKNIEKKTVFFKIDVFLTEKTTKKSFEMKETFQNYFKNQKIGFDDEGETYRRQELMRYCKESMIILFDLLKVKKIQDSLIDLKKKIILFKKFLNNYQNYPELLIEKHGAEKESFIVQNYESRLFKPENFENLKNFSILSIFPEEVDEKSMIEPEKQKEFLHFIDSNQFNPYPRPDSMSTELHPYQKQALSWFLYRENRITETELYETNPDFSKKMNPLYEEYMLNDNSSIYLNIFNGQISIAYPCYIFPGGGILADEMGLGKTIMALSLIHANKPTNKPMYNRLKPNNLSKKPVLLQGDETLQTIIVVPLSILDQWKKEILTHSVEKSIRVGTFYGNDRKKFDFSQFDVVLMTYDMLVQDYKVYQKNKKYSRMYKKTWFRVILDEAHCIKNRKSLRNQACCELKAKNRWCLTGTPIHNHLDDLYSLIKFLRVEIFGEEYTWWNTYINNNNTDFLVILKQIVGPILLRRTKTSLDSKGEFILKLPSKKMTVIEVIMEGDERKIYDNLYEKSRQEFLYFFLNGSALKNYSGIFAMIMRLRQCCDHPSLVYRPMDNKELESEIKNFLVRPNYVEKDKKKKGMLDTSSEAEIEGFINVHPEQETTAHQKKLIDEIVNMIRTNQYENCPICLVDMIEASLTKCGHVGCYECLSKSIKMKKQCPICRACLQKNEIGKLSITNSPQAQNS